MSTILIFETSPCVIAWVNTPAPFPMSGLSKENCRYRNVIMTNALAANSLTVYSLKTYPSNPALPALEPLFTPRLHLHLFFSVEQIIDDRYQQ
jgi:hypothetical protein